MSGFIRPAGLDQVPASLRGAMVAIDPPPPELAEGGAAHDLIRDVAAELGLGLMRLQPDRRHLEDVFLDGGTRV